MIKLTQIRLIVEGCWIQFSQPKNSAPLRNVGPRNLNGWMNRFEKPTLQNYGI